MFREFLENPGYAVAKMAGRTGHFATSAHGSQQGVQPEGGFPRGMDAAEAKNYAQDRQGDRDLVKYALDKTFEHEASENALNRGHELTVMNTSHLHSEIAKMSEGQRNLAFQREQNGAHLAEINAGNAHQQAMLSHTTNALTEIAKQATPGSQASFGVGSGSFSMPSVYPAPAAAQVTEPAAQAAAPAKKQVVRRKPAAQAAPAEAPAPAPAEAPAAAPKTRVTRRKAAPSAQPELL